MKRSYRVAGIKFTFEGDFDYKEEAFYQLFRVNDDMPDDYYFEYIKTENIKELDIEPVYSNERFDIYIYNDREYRCFKNYSEGTKRYTSVLYLEDNRGRFYYTKEYDTALRLPNSLAVFNNQMFERMLIGKDAFILHSSYIVYNGRAVLFSAPSQTGKSTQADLWREYARAAVINGDRAVLKKENGVWYVHSLPMCGSSRICRNVSSPLGSIVLLSKASHNILNRANPRTAISRLYRECTVNSWKEDFVNKVLDMLTDIYYNVNIYEYACTKEQDAVYTLKKEIDRSRQSESKN